MSDVTKDSNECRIAANDLAILVTDAKGFLKHFHFSMDKMAFSFGVALELVRTRKKRHVRINLQGQPLLQQTHQPLECYIIFWKRPAKMSKTMPCPSRDRL